MIKNNIAKGMLAAGMLASYLTLGEAPIYAQVKPHSSYGQTQDSEKSHGLVVSSNKDSVLAQLAIESLKNAGMDDAFMYKIKINNETYYRSVVPFGKEGLASIKGKVSELSQFDVSKSFAIPLVLEDAKGKKKTLEGKISNYASSAIEKVLSRQDYVSKVAPYVKQVHDGFYKRDRKVLAPHTANQVMNLIYDAAKEFKAPLMRVTAHYLHESKGDPFAKGDLDKAPNIALGPFQTRVNTIDYSLKKMRVQGVRGLPENVKDASHDLRTLVRIGVWYYMHNLNQSGSTMELATKRFNAGHNKKNPMNNGYLMKVLGEEKKLSKALK